MSRLNRPWNPKAGIAAYKTYQLIAPISTHFRRATCAEVDCPGYLNGWRTTLAADDERCDYIRRHSGRRFTEERTADGMVTFHFSPGQMCFRAGEHVKSLEREPLYIVRDGDHRGNPTGHRRLHVNGADWIDDFGTHQQRIADEHQAG